MDVLITNYLFYPCKLVDCARCLLLCLTQVLQLTLDAGDAVIKAGDRNGSFDLTDDGSTIVGACGFGFDRDAFLWTESGGMVKLDCMRLPSPMVPAMPHTIQKIDPDGYP